jgi:hypothetical protein
MEENIQIQEQEAPQQESNEIRFISDEEVAQSTGQFNDKNFQASNVKPVNQEEQQGYEQEEQISHQQYAPEEIEGAVFEFLSERLGRSISSLDDLQVQKQEQREIDERISVIAEFVQDTGRDPRDWFIYQQLNPSEMDDITAIQVQMATEYPNLSQEEIKLLVSSKYKLDPDLHSEGEVRLSQLQMKIDADKSRKEIDSLRSRYKTPERTSENSSLIDDDWVNNMTKELEDMEGIEFDLGNGKTFTFGMDNNYKSQLAEKNARLDEFFDSYVREDGSWDYDMLNMHRTVIDNIDKVVQSVYRQGMADGQRGIVQNAANATPTSPNQGNAQPAENSLAQQLRQILRPNGGMF